MKITKSQLKRIIKEELEKVSESNGKKFRQRVSGYFPPSVTDPIIGPSQESEDVKLSLDVEALRQVLQEASDAYDPDEPDSVYSVVRGVERALEMLPEEEVPEEEVGEEDIEPLKLPNPFEQEGESAKQFTDRMARRARAEEEEEVPYGMVDPKTGKVKMTRK